MKSDVTQANSFHHMSFADMVTLSQYAFPDPIEADPEGHGLIALGGDLSATTLFGAYTQGMFPWFNENEPIAWWCPDPRCVLDPTTFEPSKSLKKLAKKSGWDWSVDACFYDVIEACSLPRVYADDTWITEDMQQAYGNLHDQGFAHSLEIWANNQLIGGLYGIKIGQVFFGESMFHHQSNASKMAFWALTVLCRLSNIQLIDCQLPNAHLHSLGAVDVPRSAFLTQLKTLVTNDDVLWQDITPRKQPVTQLLQL